MRVRKPRVVDLYAGAGLFSFSFLQAGFELVDAIELDPVAARTYAENLGYHVRVEDVRRIRPEGRCEVLLAGPPCQGFSTLGSRRPDDPRNLLSLEVARWAAILRPLIVVVENVEAFLRSKVWSCLADQLGRLGYEVSAFVLDAADFGAPQFRRRSFTIASTIGLISAPRRAARRTSVREAWRGLASVPDGRNNHLSPRPSTIALARMKVIPAGGDKRDVMRKAPRLAAPSWWKVHCEVTDAWGRMDWDRPCNTLRTALQNASKGRYIHPEQHRVISLREAARLHTVPDEWGFFGLPTQIARQIGNSVPPALGRAVARSILGVL
jgi:DNA (cytosine-5)-methyltransferase 1